MSTLTRTADRPGERADAFLARVVPDLTRSAAQRLLEAAPPPETCWRWTSPPPSR